MSSRFRRQQKKLAARSPQLSDRRAVFSAIRRSVVAIVKGPQLTAPNQSIDLKQIVIAGSGFFVDESGLVITAGHVVDKWIAAIQQAQTAGAAPEMPLVLAHAPTAKNQTIWHYFLSQTESIYRSNTFDLAVLRPKVTGEAAKEVHPVEFAPEACAEGDQIATCGYPFGTELHAQVLGGLTTIIPSFSQGVVSALLPHYAVPPPLLKRFQIHALISGGNSGGPVFDPHTGRVVGVITDSINNKVEGVVARQVPKNATGTQPGVPVEIAVDVQSPVGLALAEHAHHVLTVLNLARAQFAKQAAR